MHKPKDILFLIDSLDGGGAERIMSYLLNNLDRKTYRPSLGLLLRPDVGFPLNSDVEVQCLCDGKMPALGRVLVILFTFLLLPVSVFKSGKFGDNNRYYKSVLQQIVGGVFALKGTLQRKQPDAIVVFLQTSVVITLLTRRLFRIDVPAVCSDRILLSNELSTRRFPRINRLLMRWLYNKADGYVAVSDEARRDMLNNFGLGADKTVTIYNGLDLDKLKALAREPFPSLEKYFEDGKFHFVSIGRLSGQKGFDVLIKAFSRVSEQVDSRLIIIGEGELKNQLNELVKKLRIENKVVFAGWQKNPFPLLAAADVFVMSSRYEGFPNALMEAMAIGLPVVSTDCPSGPSELLDDGHYGLLVQNENVDELSNAMSKMAVNSSLRQKSGALASERIKDFSLSKMLSRFENVLAWSLNSSYYRRGGL